MFGETRFKFSTHLADGNNGTFTTRNVIEAPRLSTEAYRILDGDKIQCGDKG